MPTTASGYERSGRDAVGRRNSTRLSVHYEGGRKFRARCGDQEVITDFRERPDSPSRGMTPSELLVASLGMCIGIYAVSYCHSMKIPADSLRLELEWEHLKNPSRIPDVEANMVLPVERLGKRGKSLLKVATNCL